MKRLLLLENAMITWKSNTAEEEKKLLHSRLQQLQRKLQKSHLTTAKQHHPAEPEQSSTMSRPNKQIKPACLSVQVAGRFDGELLMISNLLCCLQTRDTGRLHPIHHHHHLHHLLHLLPPALSRLLAKIKSRRLFSAA